MKALMMALFAATIAACGKDHPLDRVEPAKTEAFSVDLGKDFHFELGRGSGLDGLDTVAFGRDGKVTLFRQHPQGSWQTTSLELSAEALARIFDEVKSQEIMKMPAAYHANVQDGTQWVLWIRQDEKSKAIYFNNYFPAEVRRLAERLDRELAAAGIAGAPWKELSKTKVREHEKALWSSIK